VAQQNLFSLPQLQSSEQKLFFGSCGSLQHCWPNRQVGLVFSQHFNPSEPQSTASSTSSCQPTFLSAVGLALLQPVKTIIKNTKKQIFNLNKNGFINYYNTIYKIKIQLFYFYRYYDDYKFKFYNFTLLLYSNQAMLAKLAIKANNKS
jgi:hypothetical protein